MRRSLGRAQLFITSLLACPSLSIPIAAAILVGTVAGAWLVSHLGVITRLTTSYFLVAVGLSLWLGQRRGTSHTKGPER
jgi:uncharacterized membrane protein YfcA